MSADFEKADVLLLPTDPVAKKSNKRKNVVISEVTGTQSGVGTSRFSLCWHSNEEYGTLNPEQRSELHDWHIKNGTNQGGPNYHKSKKVTNNSNGKGKFKKVIHNNNAWSKLEPKDVTLVKATAKKAKDKAKKYYGMTTKICEALISFSNGNKPPKENGGPKNDAMVLAMKLRAIIKIHEKAYLS